ncbi:MAG: hypothetical protein ACTHMM_20250 [Agriterribacter sp.]
MRNPQKKNNTLSFTTSLKAGDASLAALRSAGREGEARGIHLRYDH